MEEAIMMEMDDVMKAKLRITRIKPLICRYPVVGLDWEIIPFEGCEVARQHRGLLGARMQLLELDALRETDIRFTVKRPMGFLFFMLHGTATLYGKSGQLVSFAQRGSYYLTYNPATSFMLRITEGYRSFLVIALDRDWLCASRDSYPEFRDLFHDWVHETGRALVLPHCGITPEVWALLHGMRIAIISNLDEGRAVMGLVSRCIDIYHALLVAERQMPDKLGVIRGQLLREYLFAHFTADGECSIGHIASELRWSKWMVQKVAGETFGCPVHRYVIKLRMEKARSLLAGTDERIRDIALKIGFSGVSNFTRAFKKDCGILPREYRERYGKKHEKKLVGDMQVFF